MIIDKTKECNKCGICRSVCPVFLELKDEVMSPRGRISLVEALLEGDLSDNTKRYIDTIRTCIRCTRCSQVCPVGVKVEEIIQSARYKIAENLEIPGSIREIFRSTINNPEAFKAELVKSKNLQSSSDYKAPLWLLPLYFHEGTKIPELADETITEKYPEYIESKGEKRVALFVGCSMNYVHTDIADAAIDVLNKFGIDIYIPKEQICCGAPAMLLGDKEAAEEMAKKNILALKAQDFDAIITLCPNCGVTLKREYKTLVEDDIAPFTSRIMDISQFITIYMDYKAQPIKQTVTYHDPCYLRIGQEVKAEPRQILLGNSQYIEMDQAYKCCGLGCTLGIFHPEVSESMAEDKVEAILETKADVVATGCPGCIAFIKEQLEKRNIDKEVLHTIQILQKSLSGV
ncbi:4Fe-4S dicluster domain-containing protein [Candidatus Poribacteria bacterium]|nr:4Fe-4S dicluster domain-containing protein [Candidatus Poribacteria bacterium]